MTPPAVVCVMLTADRPAMAKRAVECFNKQTYARKRLVILDTSESVDMDLELSDLTSPMICYVHEPRHRGKTIGELRNVLNDSTESSWAEIIIHWDDDDLSHPSRIAEQVALLEASGAEAVGYREMLFWREPVHDPYREIGLTREDAGQAWLYTNHDPKYCLGSSLCYLRSAWERRPFEALPKSRGGTGEDTAWLRGVNSLGIVSWPPREGWPFCFSWKGGHASAQEAAKHGDIVDYRPQGLLSAAWADELDKPQPRMICSIHGANTQYYGADLLERSSSWKRAPEWDEYCRRAMEAARAI